MRLSLLATRAAACRAAAASLAPPVGRHVTSPGGKRRSRRGRSKKATERSRAPRAPLAALLLAAARPEFTLLTLTAMRYLSGREQTHMALQSSPRRRFSSAGPPPRVCDRSEGRRGHDTDTPASRRPENHFKDSGARRRLARVLRANCHLATAANCVGRHRRAAAAVRCAAAPLPPRRARSSRSSMTSSRRHSASSSAAAPRAVVHRRLRRPRRPRRRPPRRPTTLRACR